MSNWTPGGGEESDISVNAKVYGYGHDRPMKEVTPGLEQSEEILECPFCDDFKGTDGEVDGHVEMCHYDQARAWPSEDW